MPRWFKILLPLGLFLMAIAVPLAMQRSSGDLEGTLSGDTGPVAGARVEAHRTASGETASATSDSTGHYRLPGLTAGWYSLWITAKDYNSVSIPKVYIEAGVTLRKDVHLSRTRSLQPVTE